MALIMGGLASLPPSPTVITYRAYIGISAQR